MKRAIWADEYKIHSYEVDLKSNLTSYHLLQYLQESAWNHAENLGLGFSHLINKNLVWVLARMKLTVDTFPKWGEKIIVKTFPTGFDNLYCYRDFLIEDEKKQVIARASTTWFVINMESRRPQRTNTYFTPDIEMQQSVYNERIEKLGTVSDPSSVFTKQVLYKDVDVNGHLNNIRYVEWVLDYFNSDFRKKNQLYEVTINFINEALLDTRVMINTEKNGRQTFHHNLIRENDSKELCRVYTSWK